MKAITIREPWASLLMAGHKTFETRSWGPKQVPLLLGIHAAKTRPVDVGNWQVVPAITYDGWFTSGPARIYLHPGYLLGFALIDWVSPTEWSVGSSCPCVHDDDPYPNMIEIRESERSLGDFSEGRYAWHVARTWLLDLPIPTRGQQGLWNLDRYQWWTHKQTQIVRELWDQCVEGVAA